MNFQDVTKAIANSQCTIILDDCLKPLPWGDKLNITGKIKIGDISELKKLQQLYPIRVGVVVFDKTERVKELRGPIFSEGDIVDQMKFEVVFNTDLLRPGAHTCEIDLVIDNLTWFRRAITFEVQVEPSDKFVDVKKFAATLGVETLARGAENYYRMNLENEWMYRKPYSIKDIQHNWPQVANLIRGLELTDGMTVLDFGAGTGWISRTLSRLGLKVYSLDVSPTALELSRKVEESEATLFKHPPISYLQFDGRNIALESNSVDRVLCNDALHHVPNVEEGLAEIARVLKPGGIAGFCEPGARHSLAPRAQYEMREFQVLENDIDHQSIYENLATLGYRKMVMSILSPYSLNIDYDEWVQLKPDAPALRRYANLALVRAKANAIFYLIK